jgi:hypothetical protein
MRKFLTLAIITTIGAWVLKQLAEIGKDDVYHQGAVWSSDEEVRLQPQPVDNVFDENALPLSHEETDLQLQTADDSFAEKQQPLADEETDLQLQTADGSFAEEQLPLSDDEEGDLQSQTVDEIPVEDPSWSSSEEALQSPSEEDAPSAADTEGPVDLDRARKRRRERSKASDSWPLPAGPNEEPDFRRARAEVDERLRDLSHGREKDDEALG